MKEQLQATRVPYARSRDDDLEAHGCFLFAQPCERTLASKTRRPPAGLTLCKLFLRVAADIVSISRQFEFSWRDAAGLGIDDVFPS